MGILRLTHQIIKQGTTEREVPSHSSALNHNCVREASSIIRSGIESGMIDLNIIACQVQRLLELKTHHISGYTHEPDTRVRIGMASFNSTATELSETFEIPVFSIYKIIDEVHSAIYHLLRDQEGFDLESLNAGAQIKLREFAGIQKIMDDAEHYLSDNHFADIIADTPSLGMLLWSQQEHSSILPLLDGLGIRYETPRNVDSSFRRLLSEGYNNGNLTLLRRVLYAYQSQNPSPMNSNGAMIGDILERTALWAFGNGREKNIRLKSNTRHALTYLCVMQFIKDLNNRDIIDNGIENFYTMPERDGLDITTIAVPNDWVIANSRLDAYRSKNGSYRFRIRPEDFFIDTPNLSRTLDLFLFDYLKQKNRGEVVSAIGSLLGFSDNTARKVYDQLKRVADFALMVDHTPNRLDIPSRLASQNIDAVYNRIKQVVSSST